MTLVKVFKHEFQAGNACNYFQQASGTCAGFPRMFRSLQFHLLAPDFVIWQQREDPLEGSSRNIRIILNSKFVFYIDDHMWSLGVQLLGFGLGVVRQWGY